MTIYLDCNATTPIDPEVMEVVRHYMEVDFGNAGSRTHEFGLRAKQAVERAREQVAAVVDAKPDEVIFTSGATESNNLAILGLEEEGRRSGRMHIVSTQIEHKAVLEPLSEMQKRGFEITLVAPGSNGVVAPESILSSVRSDTLLVSVMHVNNETGVLQPLASIAGALGHHPAYLHTDAAQGYGKVQGLEDPRIDLISCSAHKVFGPKGVGALIARRRRWESVPLRPLVYGGGQERGLRAGTLPTPLIAGMGVACSLATSRRAERDRASLDNRLALMAILPRGCVINGAEHASVPWVMSVQVPACDSEAVMLALKGIADISNGSACTSARYEPSHVLQAMGLTHQQCSQSIRLSWCHHFLAPASIGAIGQALAAMMPSSTV